MSKKHQPKPKKRTHTTTKNTASVELKGTLDLTRSGMGYVIIDGSKDKDILVRQQDLGVALSGDTVRVKIVKQSQSGRKEGRITEVIQRKQTEFIGRLSVQEHFAFFIAASEKPMPDIYIPKNKIKNTPDNSKVIVRLTEWENNKKKPVGEVVSVVTEEQENDFAMKGIIAENGFSIEFPKEVMHEANKLTDKIPDEEIAKRKDFRKTLTFTIDPVDAKDFDDAISIKKLDKEWYEIGVHIADVSHFVTPDTELDKEAYSRATSVYLPDRVIPMLPEHISNVLCSLRPNEDKLTFSAVFIINKKGKIKEHWIGKTVIHSDKRFTYEDVQQIIDTKEGLLKDDVLLLNEIAQKLRAERFSNGAINFSSQEVRFKLDEKGKPIGIEIKESKPAHQLIEELMLLANRYVATYAAGIKIHGKPIPFPYRIHDQPDEAKLENFIPFAKKYGYHFDLSTPEGIAKSFNEMLEKAHGKPEQHVLEQLGIRTMAKAIYTSENIGHYGLGFENYCHFTSPIRRYPDVMVHRIIEDCLKNHPQVDKKLEEKCKHCSDKERAAMDAERAANKYKQVEYMQQFLGDEFEGIITGVAEFGFWVETVEQKCEGLVSVQSLNFYDDFRYVESDYMLAGSRSGRRFQMGDKVWIKVVAANLDKRQLDYEWVLKSDSTKKKEKTTTTKKKKKSNVGQKKEK
ncbi:ribonuclease R [Arachidicoccus ginsenosidimutans]|uniref:ribonuclease R n=1 Tax=Arachidicoccus sp. BS20 TaxID=1850526 RepID=UPI0007F0F912|nr:ribonuclease R [Arachidicoccus sp. BS20]ANI88402.1 ribonuclease R [Arachidicoccus sp. BS20]